MAVQTVWATRLGTIGKLVHVHFDGPSMRVECDLDVGVVGSIDLSVKEGAILWRSIGAVLTEEEKQDAKIK